MFFLNIIFKLKNYEVKVMMVLETCQENLMDLKHCSSKIVCMHILSTILLIGCN
ncbi:hypothetical protein LINPERHAP2_LOCUS3436 [Linum perenne]